MKQSAAVLVRMLIQSGSPDRQETETVENDPKQLDSLSIEELEPPR